MALSTVQFSLFTSVVAAKQMVTDDHISRGRFGLNLVCGWNHDEFDMLGVDLAHGSGTQEAQRFGRKPSGDARAGGEW
jgi:alkanesulfonate monooxygenase SsuD/methylene tetrahydromethanopterin reductase-like flavin-dependent oxidoreductase (luciferase family)